MNYRPEIDGLRAVAIISVILFHTGLEPFSGGFVGVDVFFVISGYLITKLVHGEIASDRFSLIRFYERRARRILPALFLICLISLAVGWWVLLPDQFAGLGSSIVAVAGFASNFYFWRQGDYFNAPAESFPLHHTWSLAVEEQFYILFPLLLLALRWSGSRRTLYVLLLVTAGSLALAEFGSRADPSANFYLMPSRAWELGVGALVAIADLRPRTWRPVMRQLIASIGLMMVLYAAVCFDPSIRHPSAITLVPVLGTAGLLATALPDTVVGRLLAARALVGIGLVSYSAYLWHQPIFVFAEIYHGQLVAADYVGLIALTFGLSLLSWRYVEQPFRRQELFTGTRILQASLAGCIALLCAGLSAHYLGGDSARLDAERAFVAQWSRDRSPSYQKCIFRHGDGRSISDACVFNQSDNAKVAFIGDSHASSITNQLAGLLSTAGQPLIELTHTACPPVAGLNIEAGKGRGCADFNVEVRSRLAQSDIDTVIVLSRWSQYISSAPFHNGEGGTSGWTAIASPVGNTSREMSEEHRIEQVTSLYTESVESLLNLGKRVVLVYPIPEVGWNTPAEMARRIRVSAGRPAIVSTSLERFRIRNAATYAALDNVAPSPRLIRVKPERLFCDTYVPGRCVAELDGRPLYWDDSHVNESLGARMIASQIKEAMDANGWL